MTYPLENLFRPAVERHAALAALAAASGVIAWPQVLMLTPGAGLVVAALLFAHALRREVAGGARAALSTPPPATAALRAGRRPHPLVPP